MSTAHPHPDHHHPHGEHELKAYTPLYLKAWGLTFVIAGIGIAGSVLSGSFALLADVTHVFTDTLVGLAPVSVEFFRHRTTIPARKLEAAGGVAVAVVLFLIGAHIIESALGAISGGEEHAVSGGLMFLFALLAAIVNFMQHRLLSRVSPMHRHAAHAGFHFHVLTDLVKNIILPLVAAAIYLGAPPGLDIWAGCAIGVLIVLRAALLLLESVLGRRILSELLSRFFLWVAR